MSSRSLFAAFLLVALVCSNLPEAFANTEDDEALKTQQQKAMCFGCDTVVEYMYDEIIDALEKHAKAAAAKPEKRLEIPIDKFLNKICQNHRTKDLQGGVQGFCSFIAQNWTPQIANVFQGYQNEITQMWPKKKQICVDMYKLCPAEFFHPIEPAQARRLTQCQKCQIVVSDIEFVMARGNPQWKHYRTKKHIIGVLDDVCQFFKHRHDAEVTAAVFDTCEELVSDEEDALIAAFGKGVPDMPTLLRDVCVKAADMCTADQIQAMPTPSSPPPANPTPSKPEEEEEEDDEDDDGHDDDEL